MSIGKQTIIDAVDNIILSMHLGGQKPSGGTLDAAKDVVDSLGSGDLKDIIYNLADRKIKEFDPCKFDEEGRCEEGRVPRNIDTGLKSCCHNRTGNTSTSCKFLCGPLCTIRALRCKLYLCVPRRHDYPYLRDYLDFLLVLACQYYDVHFYEEAKERS